MAEESNVRSTRLNMPCFGINGLFCLHSLISGGFLCVLRIAVLSLAAVSGDERSNGIDSYLFQLGTATIQCGFEISYNTYRSHTAYVRS